MRKRYMIQSLQFIDRESIILSSINKNKCTTENTPSHPYTVNKMT